MILMILASRQERIKAFIGARQIHCIAHEGCDLALGQHQGLCSVGADAPERIDWDRHGGWLTIESRPG